MCIQKGIQNTRASIKCIERYTTTSNANERFVFERYPIIIHRYDMLLPTMICIQYRIHRYYYTVVFEAFDMICIQKGIQNPDMICILIYRIEAIDMICIQKGIQNPMKHRYDM